jgi:hypothetical protein
MVEKRKRRYLATDDAEGRGGVHNKVVKED